MELLLEKNTLFLDKICESLNIDFQSIKDIKNKSLINIDIQIDEEDFSTLDIDFNLPILMQIQQAENELHSGIVDLIR